MQVQRIQSNNTAFGYNPTVNAQLVSYLENTKKNKAFYSYVKNLVLSTNKAERDLKAAEKKHYKTLLAAMISSFIPAKIMITDMVNSMFPEFGYRQKEIDSYSEEIKQRDIKPGEAHWLNALRGMLIDNEAQHQAVVATEILSQVMNSQFPYIKMDFSGLTGAFKQHYLGEDVAYDEPDEEYIDGSDKVVHYEPKGNALLGFAGLGGMKELKEVLSDKIVDYLKNPAQARLDNVDYGTELPNAILLYGPPGCGKTTIVEHLSVEADTPLLEVRPGKFGSIYANGTEQNLEAMFDYAASVGSENKPVILFIDDVDMVIGSRDENGSRHKKEELGTFLTRIQNAHNDNILVIAATNKYDQMDTAVKRRFDDIYVGLPDLEARESLFEFFLSQNAKSAELAKNKEAITKLAKQLEGYPISAIKSAIAEACDIPRKEAKLARLEGNIVRRDVTEDDIVKVISKPEMKNKKIKEDLYKTNATRPPMGFGQ